MTNEQVLRTALADLVEQCRDFFHGDSGFPLADALERAEAALKQVEPKAPLCDHDIEVFTQMDRAWAECRKCGKKWEAR